MQVQKYVFGAMETIVGDHPDVPTTHPTRRRLIRHQLEQTSIKDKSEEVMTQDCTCSVSGKILLQDKKRNNIRKSKLNIPGLDPYKRYFSVQHP